MLTAAFVLGLVTAIAFSGCGGAPDSTPSDNPGNPGGGPLRPDSQCYTAGGDSGHSTIQNGQGNPDAVSSGMLVLGGDQVTIQPISVVRQESTPFPPLVNRLDNDVCVQTTDVCAATEPIIQHKCRYSCHFGNSCPAPSIGNSMYCCTETCQDVHTGDRCVLWAKQCVRQQNQWTETSLFSGLDSPKPVEDRSPLKSQKSTDDLIAGLNLRFSSSDESGNIKSVDCPLKAFKPSTDTAKITFQLGDVAGCPLIFGNYPERFQTLGFVNLMSESMFYSTGSLVKTWDGRVLAQPDQSIYHPEIDLSATVCVQAGASPK